MSGALEVTGRGIRRGWTPKRKLFEHFRSLTKDRIAIPISHRFSTVRYADQIVVLDEGRVIEQRSHEELMRRRGRYASCSICRLVPIASDCQNTSSVG